MQPDPHQNNNINNDNTFQKHSKSNQSQKPHQCLIQQQTNHYRTALPQTAQTFHELFSLSYTTIGFHVGHIPPHLSDLWAVIINQIHCSIDNCVLKVIIGEQQSLWVTVVFGVERQEIDMMRFNVLEANYSEALQKTRNVVRKLLQETKRQDVRVNDKEILGMVRKDISKKIKSIFKNPYLDD